LQGLLRSAEALLPRPFLVLLHGSDRPPMLLCLAQASHATATELRPAPTSSISLKMSFLGACACGA
jgi:hypothetical protein